MISNNGTVGPTILVVDDEPHVLEAIADLCGLEFDVIGAGSGEEALSLLEQREVAVILADQRMPQMTGTELLIRASRLRPEATRILLTGYSDLEAVVRAINEGAVYHYATKPWDPEALLVVLRRAAERHALILENRRIVATMAEQPPASDEWKHLAHTAAELDRLLLERDNERLQAVLAHFRDSFWHLQKLQEVLPVCMGCGRVRDERGVWLSLPAFLQKHAAFLSHGYCPPCEALLDVEEGTEDEREGT